MAIHHPPGDGIVPQPGFKMVPVSSSDEPTIDGIESETKRVLAVAVYNHYKRITIDSSRKEKIVNAIDDDDGVELEKKKNRDDVCCKNIGYSILVNEI
ncbi:hypothetical protein LXL04_033326 [Taraxacum kok-saghyz]